MILDTEVTKAALMKDIDFKSKEVIDLIAIYEDIINDDLTIDNINGLLSLYQKAIEYFSAIDSGRYEDFLSRNKRLLQREDVQMVLNSIQDEERKQDPELKKSHSKSLNPPTECAVRRQPDVEAFRIESDESEDPDPGRAPADAASEETKDARPEAPAAEAAEKASNKDTGKENNKEQQVDPEEESAFQDPFRLDDSD